MLAVSPDRAACKPAFGFGQRRYEAGIERSRTTTRAMRSRHRRSEPGGGGANDASSCSLTVVFPEPRDKLRDSIPEIGLGAVSGQTLQ